MSMLTPATTALLASSACYAFTRGCEYLCMRPNIEGRVASVFESVQLACAATRDFLAQRVLGQWLWSVLSDIVFKNAWISTYVVVLLMFPSFSAAFTATEMTLFIYVFVYTAGIASVVRSALESVGEELAKWVYPFPGRTQIEIESFEDVLRYLASFVVGRNDTPSSPFRLQALSFIPEELYDDPVFSQYTCLINQTPARHPVFDPNRHTLYDREAIETWIRLRGSSPATRAPLSSAELLPNHEIQEAINRRLALYETHIRAAIQTVQQLPPNAS